MNSPYPMRSNRSKSTFIAFLKNDEDLRQVSLVSKTLGIENAKFLKGPMANTVKFLSNKPSPEILFVDISEEEFPLDRIDELAEVCSPNTKVAVVGDRDSVGLYRSLMERGVSDYLVRPLPEDLLINLLKSLSQGQEVKRKVASNGKTIGVIGAAGGVGVSSLVANAGYYLSEEKKSRTTIISFSANNYFSMLFGEKQKGGLTDLLSDPERLDDLLLERSLQTLGDRLDLLGISSEDELFKIDQSSLKNLVSKLVLRCHYVLFDYPSNCSTDQFTNYCACDKKYLLVPPTLRGGLYARDLIQKIEKLGTLEGLQVVLSYARPASRDTLKLNEIEEVIGRKIEASIRFSSATFTKSELEGKPAFSHKPKGDLIYREVLSLISQNKHNKSKKPFFNWPVWGGLDVWKTQ